jgi:adenine-specific DNA-methyltransferase
MTAARPLSKLLAEADCLRRSATPALDPELRGERGQFLTPSDMAALMASMFEELPEDIRLLDAGAGVGALTAALVAEACTKPQKPDSLSVTAFELDSVLLPSLRTTLERCRRHCSTVGIRFAQHVHPQDFIEASVEALCGSLFGNRGLSFNTAILNPPYRKMGTASRERRLLRQVGLDATNLYAAFVSLTIKLLEEGGQLVAIIPRSFCNGPYFRAFREVLLRETALLRIHIFDSRKQAFKEDGVLQENVILHLRRTVARPRHVLISSSTTATSEVTARQLAYEDVVRRVNGDSFIHIPAHEEDDAISTWMALLPDTLTSLGVTVSTGRVVDFRARASLRMAPDPGTVPLIYPCHFDNGQVRWPKENSRKPNALVHSSETQPLLVPRGFYVVTRRFSSKEEKRRLVAAVYDPEQVPAPFVGFENHINYFHRDGAGLDRDEAYGLAAFLNSGPIDRYFRQFNGHTQVNATDLRSLRFPSLVVLRRLGRKRAAPGSADPLVLEEYPLPR